MRVGFIGLGIMGSRMAANLRRAGHELVVHNRTRETAEGWAAEHGAEVAGRPAEIRAEVVITMLVDGEQVQEALLGPDGAATDADDTLFVDMSTIGPEAARALAGRLPAFVDAPVTGSSPKAEDGTLTIMAGGEAEHVQRAWPLFEAMGQLVVHAGPVGHGQQIKVINNAVAAANTNTLGQALLVGSATGVDLDALVAVMGAGSGGSAMLGLKAAPMREHDWTTLFKLEHMLKDVRLCLDSGQAAGVGFPAAAAAREVLSAAMGRDLGDADFAALLEVLEGQAGRRLNETP
ncbi:MAG: 6-phosphogluconate dehydrogenase NAD-binding protein [Solirubrobacteraceae bacterium]|nr:6-phosphogluconate dehydrogenase NAD-binding protein [Solirubrobacteraceae bacterium]